MRKGQAIAPDEAVAWLSGWRLHALLWSVLFAAAGYLAFAIWSGWRDVVAAAAEVGVVGMAAALALSLVNYGLRFCRWQAYLAAMEHPVPGWPSLKIYLAGFALTTTPGKTGETLRGLLLKRWHMPYQKSLAAFLSERLSDLLAVVLLTLAGLALYPAARPLVLAGALAVVAAFVVLASERVLGRLRNAVAGGGRWHQLLRQVFDILLQARRCHTPALLAAATVLSLVAWAAEAWAFHLILGWMGLDMPFAFAVFVYAIAMLAGALSFMPGGLGGAERQQIDAIDATGLLTALADQSAMHNDLFADKELSFSEAMAKLFQRLNPQIEQGERNYQVMGDVLLDYRNYLELEIEVQRGADGWLRAESGALSTGEAIGTGQAILLMVLISWEEESRRLRGKDIAPCRLLFLDEAAPHP